MDKMDKEDILVRSRNDNRKGDEREVQNRTNAELFSYWIVIVILFVTALLSDAGVIGGEILSMEDHFFSRILYGCLIFSV